MARNYKKEYENYHSSPKQKKNRASRNAWGVLLVTYQDGVEPNM